MSEVHDVRPALHYMLAVVDGNHVETERLREEHDLDVLLDGVVNLMLTYPVSVARYSTTDPAKAYVAGIAQLRDWLSQTALDQDIDPINEKRRRHDV